MIRNNHILRVMLLAAALLFTAACLLPGMIPLSAANLPTAEKNVDTVIETLNGDDWVSLQSLVVEQYTEEEISRPGILSYTATIPTDVPVYFNYGWCATSEDILRQNFEHIKIVLTINDIALGNSEVHFLSYSLTNGLVCTDVGTLLSDWSAGTYHLSTSVTFDETINDGMSDYGAGDYISEFTVTIEE